MRYSFNASELIDELSADIAEFGNEEVWAYGKVMDNKQEIYFDYCPLDDPELEDDPEYQPVSVFDKKVGEAYPVFFKKKIKSKDLLKIFIEENKII